MREGAPGGERAVSEIYGTFLIIAVVFLMALVLVGVGMFAFEDITEDADNEVVQQSILEFDERVSELTAQDVEGSTSIEFPDGTASDINAQSGHGNVNITIKTHEAYWDATDSPGALLEDADNQTASYSVTLGSLVYENNDGKITAYQGGAVWEKQSGDVSLVSPPDLYADNQTLELSFVDISSIDLVQDGNEISLRKQPGAGSAAENITELVEQQMRSQYPDGRYVANATVSLNITSAFAEGWAEYAESNLGADTDVHEASEVDGDRPVAEIDLGTYGEQNTINQSREYAENVTYTGLGEFAQDLYDNGTDDAWTADIANQSNAAFNVTAPGWDTKKYTVGILYNNDTRGNGPEWWAYNGTDGRWWNVEDPHAAPLNTSMIPESVVDASQTDPGEDKFGVAADTWGCVVATGDAHDPDDFRAFVPNATEYTASSSNGCLESPVGVNTSENWKDYVGDFETDFVIDDFRTKIYNGSGVLVHDSSGGPTLDPNTDALEPGYEVEMTLNWTNEGYRNATAGESPVAFVYDEKNKSETSITLPSDPWIVWGERVGTDKGENDSRTFSFPVENADSVYEFWVGAGTKHDGVEPSATWEVQVDTPSTFEPSDISVDDAGAVEGDEVEVSVDINNTGSTGDSQTVFLWGSTPTDEEKHLINSTELTLPPDPPNNTTTETFTWTTQEGRESDWENVTVKAPVSGTKAAANISVDPASSDPAEFTIESVSFNGTALSDGDFAGTVEEGEDAVVILNVNNTGGKEGIQQVTLDRDGIDDDDSARTNSTTLELAPGDSPKQVALEWKTIPGDASGDPYTLKLQTDDDEFTFELTVLQRTDGSEFDVNIASVSDPVLAGDTMFVNGTVTNTGEDDTQTLYLKTVGIPDQQSVAVDTGETKPFNMSWETGSGDVGTHNVTVLADDDRDTAENVSVEPRDLGEAEFDVSIESTTTPVTEGEPLAVDINVTNTGTAPGATVVALKDFDDKFVNVTSEELSFAEGESKQVTLTWYTLVGLVEGDASVTDEITVDADGQNATDTASVTVKPRNATRLPADVVFAIDETGSMGDPDYFPEKVDTDPPKSGTLTVPEDEMWLVTADESSCPGFFCDVFNDGYFVTGQTINFSAYNYDDWTNWEIEKYDYPSTGSDKNIERVPAVWTALSAMNKTLDRAAAMQYDTSQNFLTGLGDIAEVNESLRVAPGGNTDIAGAISAAENKLVSETDLDYGNPDSDRYQTVILLTDGIDNSGADPVSVANETNMSHGSQPLDFSVYTVGFGNADEEVLKDVARYAGNGDGNYTKADNPEELAGIFEGLIKEITEEKEPEVAINSAEINGSEDIAEGETVTIEAEIENAGEGVGDVPVTLLDWEGNPVDSTLVNVSSAGLASGESKTVQLSWDTTGVLDGDINTDNVTVVASGNENPTAVTVEDKSAFFDVGIQSVDDGVEEGETVTVNVSVENTDNAPDTQTLWLEYQDESGNNQTLATSAPVELDGGENTSTSIDWQTGIGDGDIESITVHSENDMEAIPVDVKRKEVTEAEFAVDITTTASPVTIGDQLDVTAEIENVNGTDETYPGQVVLTVGSVEKDSKIVALSDGESTTETFTWWTDDTGDSIDVEVRAATDGGENSSSEEVTVDDVDNKEETFKISDVATNADDGVDSITEDETLTVDIDVKNDGDGAGSQTLIVRRNDSGQGERTDVTTVDTGTIPEDSTETVTVSLSPSDFSAETDKIIVESEDDFSGMQTVDIEPTDDTQVNIDIDEDAIAATDQAQAVEAGEPISVPVEITNGGSTDITEDLFVSLDAVLSPKSIEQSPANFTVLNIGTLAPENTTTATLVWDTTGAGWDDDHWQLTVESEGESDIVQVYVDELDGALPGGPDFGGIGSGIDFTIDDIEVAE
ncbi:CARDB domain-containing protein [Halovenus aranensis]|nr:CARDB domain-containing protein [Halovenus aranensis]